MCICFALLIGHTGLADTPSRTCAATRRLASPRLTSPHATSPQRRAAAHALRPCAPSTLAAGRSEVKGPGPSLSSIAGSSSAAAGLGVSSPQTPGATGDSPHSPHSPHTEAGEGHSADSSAPPADAVETQRYQTVTRAALQANAEKSRKAMDDTALLQQQGFDE